jgi:hypothetical protein
MLILFCIRSNIMCRIYTSDPPTKTIPPTAARHGSRLLAAAAAAAAQPAPTKTQSGRRLLGVDVRPEQHAVVAGVALGLERGSEAALLPLLVD